MAGGGEAKLGFVLMKQRSSDPDGRTGGCEELGAGFAPSLAPCHAFLWLWRFHAEVLVVHLWTVSDKIVGALPCLCFILTSVVCIAEAWGVSWITLGLVAEYLFGLLWFEFLCASFGVSCQKSEHPGNFLVKERWEKENQGCSNHSSMFGTCSLR